MTPQPAPVAQAIESLVSALAESRGWMRDYSRSIIEDAIEREQPGSSYQAQPSGEAATAQPSRVPSTEGHSPLLQLAGDRCPCERCEADRKADSGCGADNASPRSDEKEEPAVSALPQPNPFAVKHLIDERNDALDMIRLLENIIEDQREKLEAALPQQGWVLVPVHPTRAMKAAGAAVCSQGFDIAHHTYAAMLAALAHLRARPPVDSEEWPDQRNRGLLQAAKQALSALDRHALKLPWGQPDYPTPTPGANLLYEAREYLRPAIKREESFRAVAGHGVDTEGRPTI